MTEKEKMLKGLQYNSSDKELLKERMEAKKKVYVFNHTLPEEEEKRVEILKTLFGEVGKNIYMEPPIRCDYGYNMKIGDNFYANYNCCLLDCMPIVIGNNVWFGPNVSIFTASHPIEPELRLQNLEIDKPITIEDNVWIGGGSIINPGVTIGKNSVIGSGSVVTKNIPENCVAVGNPCKVVKKMDNKE